MRSLLIMMVLMVGCDELKEEQTAARIITNIEEIIETKPTTEKAEKILRSGWTPEGIDPAKLADAMRSRGETLHRLAEEIEKLKNGDQIREIENKIYGEIF